MNLGGIFADFIKNAKIIEKNHYVPETYKRLICSILQGLNGYNCTF